VQQSGRCRYIGEAGWNDRVPASTWPWQQAIAIAGIEAERDC
jgi:hypothetical protein